MTRVSGIAIKAIVWPFIIAACTVVVVVYAPFIAITLALDGPADADQLLLP